jgi:hypothetical protein
MKYTITHNKRSLKNNFFLEKSTVFKHFGTVFAHTGLSKLRTRQSTKIVFKIQRHPVAFCNQIVDYNKLYIDGEISSLSISTIKLI